MKKVIVTLVIFSLFTGVAFGMGMHLNKKGVVVAAFGTSYPTALGAILNIYSKVKSAFPKVDVRLAFTSSIIRSIWHKRANDRLFKKEHPEIPKGIYHIKSPLALLADMSDEGYRTIAVQPLQLTDGEEYQDLVNVVDALVSIRALQLKNKPFRCIALGRPLLGRAGVYKGDGTYHEDLKAVAVALKPDVEFAVKKRAALVYMGHGNEHRSTGLYYELQEELRSMYPKVKIFVGTVEGHPTLDNVVSTLKSQHVRKVVLKPLMVVAGDHANNDMAGNDKDSWKMVMKRAGIRVIPVIKGLGSVDSIANIYVQHLKDAIKWAGLSF